MLGIEKMTCVYRGCRGAGLVWPLVLAAGICLVVTGCGSTPSLNPGLINPATWLFSGPGSKAETEALKKKVEADSFPTAADAGI